MFSQQHHPELNLDVYKHFWTFLDFNLLFRLDVTYITQDLVAFNGLKPKHLSSKLDIDLATF